MGLDKSKSIDVTTGFALWIVPLMIVLTALLFMFGGEDARDSLRFDRVWIAEGESWRWLTGHLSHLGWSHFALNSAGLLLVWYLVGPRYPARTWLLNIGVTIVVIDAGFWFFSPGLHWYVGLSGLLHGLLAAGIAARLRPLDAETVLLTVLLLGKLAWEQVAGPIPGSEATSGGMVVVDAHLYGTLGGILAALLARIRVLPRASI